MGGTAFPLLTQNMSCIALVNFERKISENNIFTFSGLPVAEYEDVVHLAVRQRPKKLQ